MIPYRESDSTAFYEDYVNAQTGGYPVFAGRTVMGGGGFGSVLSGLLRSAAPLLKSGAKALGKRALNVGIKTAGDVLGGQNVKSSLKRHASESVNDIFWRRGARLVA